VPLGEDGEPLSAAGDLDDVPVAALRFATRRPQFTAAEQRERRAAYFAAVTYMDAQLGRVLAALDAAGLAGSTVVVFAGDHGQHLGEHGGLWAKLTLFEESLRVPLLVAGPGVPAAASSPCAVELLDLFPTVAGLAGVAPPPGLEGRDLSPLLTRPDRCGGLAGGDRGALSEIRLTARPGSGQPDRMARSLTTERYRYTEWGSPAEAELYDHQADPGEQRNLARDEVHRGLVEEQRKKLEARLAAIEEARRTATNGPYSR
jgi:arylsulfatase A-like enzyme